MPPLTITLPYPVSANRYWRSFVPRGHQRAVVTLSDDAKAYRARVGTIARSAGVGAPMQGRVALGLHLYPAMPQDAKARMRKLGERWDDGVRSIDLDNALKVVIDALKGILYEDDKQVWQISAQRCEPVGEARAVLTLAPIAAVKVQEELAL